MELTRTTVIHLPPLFAWHEADLWFFLDGDGPHWIATEERGAKLVGWLADGPPFGELVARYAGAYQMEAAKAWLHVSTFIQELLRVGLAQATPIAREPYLGRAAYLTPTRLAEAWLHTNNSCNLTCAHCLVSSSPSGERGLPTAQLISLIDELADLGAARFYFTGGEPFARPDIFALIDHVTQAKRAELIILTNATLFEGERLTGLAAADRARLKLQVSLDGANPATNDRIRGAGSFAAATEGLRRASRLGFDTSLTTVVTAANAQELTQLTRLARELGAKAQHLMWLHKRGRVVDGGPRNGPARAVRRTASRVVSRDAAGAAGGQATNGWFVPTDRLIELVRAVKRDADQLGVIVDNYESLKWRVNGRPHVKYDLGTQGWASLCVYADGHLYPSAAMANHKPLDCGQASNGVSLKELWLNSPVLQQIRQASLVRNAARADDPFRFLTGGGDIEHSYFYSGEFCGEDPYYPLYVAMAKELMVALACDRRRLVNRRSGYDAPRLIHAMGEGAITCGQDALAQDGGVEVAMLHSNCVLAFDVDKPRELVRGFYAQAAEQPQAELCCPVKYDDADVAHIPREVLERFYGCGSPIALAAARAGETVVDLGCGAGIDCFIAAKHVGPSGRVIGIDMTDQMLSVANQAKPAVARTLGYDAVEFRKGFLEQVPVEDRSADLVISNCVINLSPDKRAVFREMWRMLKDCGRMCVADIVSERAVPARLKVNPQLWGECTVGALTEQEFLAYAEQAGFYGVRVLKKAFYKTIEGYPFYSVTVLGYKFEKTAGCRYVGQRAVYHGPFKAVMDEEGHLFPRGVAIEVCTDTAAKLSRPPYQGLFTVTAPAGTGSDAPAAPDRNGVETTAPACGPGCC